MTGDFGYDRQTAIEGIGQLLLEKFHLDSLVITGVDMPGEDGIFRMGNLVLDHGKKDWCFSVKEGGSYSGTGDLFASVLSAGMVK